MLQKINLIFFTNKPLKKLSGFFIPILFVTLPHELEQLYQKFSILSQN